jgi:penicillin amidase
VAQGFVQAEDRLFQMDLWRRSVQGRLSEVLGANFLERDAMTRRIQFHGDVQQDWASYGADAERIARAFTRGINAWVRIARQQVPEEFRMAGWLPQEWQPDELLNRTDAFLSSVSGGEDEVLRARLIAVIGAAKTDAVWPLAGGERTVVDPAADLTLFGPLVGAMLRRVGTEPFFLGLAAAPTTPAAADRNPPATARRERLRDRPDVARVADGGSPLTAALGSTLDSPASRYVVHLTAPGWNVIGATAPWLPGVAVGHNDEIAWGFVRHAIDVQDLYVEQLNQGNPRQVRSGGRWIDMEIRPDTVPIKGRNEPFEFERQYTPHGVVIGVDRERGMAFVVRWPGTEPGTAGELGALAIDRARSVDEFRAALARWKLPVAEFVVMDRDGRTGSVAAGLAPSRRGANGALPTAGWTNQNVWRGWTVPDRRATRERASAALLIPLIERLRSTDPTIEMARSRLLAWNREMSADSPEAALFARWSRVIAKLAIERRVPADFVNDLARRIDAAAIVTQPGGWFDAPRERRRDALLMEALAVAVKETPAAGDTWGDVHRATFMHPLGISAQASRVFNIGPLASGGDVEIGRATFDAESGQTFRAVLDSGDWDRSLWTIAPGQSGSPASPHYADLVKLWAAGQYATLPFSEAAVKAAAESTLTLVPER